MSGPRGNHTVIDLEAGSSGVRGNERRNVFNPPPQYNYNPQQNQRLQNTQKQVDEVVEIMRTNVEKVLERDSRLNDLDQRSDKLQQGASQFHQQSKALKRKYWYQNMKMMIIMGIIGLFVAAILLYSFFGS